MLPPFAALSPALVEGSRNFIAYVNEDLDVAYLNPSAAAITRISWPPATPFSLKEILEPDVAKALRRSIEIAADGPTVTQPLELRPIGAETTVPLGVDVYLLTESAPRWFAVLGRDLRESRRVENVLRQRERALFHSETRLKAALFGGHQGLWDWNRGERTFYVDALFSILFGLDVHQAPTRQQVLRCIHPDDRARCFAVLQQALLDRTTPVVDCELRLAPTLGPLKWIAIRGRVVERNYDGQVMRIVGTVQEITGRKQLESDLVESNRHLAASLERTHALMQEAQSANRAKSEFLANFSHEVRTPMNGVIGTLSLLAASSQNTETQDYAETALASARHLLGVLNDVLDLQRLESGRLSPESVTFPTEELWEAVRLTACGATPKPALALQLTPGRDLPDRLNGDLVRIRQVLVNLVANAHKFTPQGEVEVMLDGHAGGLMMTVRDTGIGIPREQHEQIFEAFTQADPSTTRCFGGSGLGLAIVSRTVSLLGGRMELDSEVGRGSTFRVWLPGVLGGSSPTKDTPGPAPTAAGAPAPSTGPRPNEEWLVLGGTSTDRAQWISSLAEAGLQGRDAQDVMRDPDQEAGRRARGFLVLDEAARRQARRFSLQRLVLEGTVLQVVVVSPILAASSDSLRLNRAARDSGEIDLRMDPALMVPTLARQPAPPPPLPVLDPLLLLNQLEGDEAIAVEAWRLFLEQLRLEVDAVAQAWTDGDREQASASLKGLGTAAASAGALRLAEVVARMTVCLVDGCTEDPMTTLRQAARDVIVALEPELTRLEAA